MNRATILESTRSEKLHELVHVFGKMQHVLQAGVRTESKGESDHGDLSVGGSEKADLLT